MIKRENKAHKKTRYQEPRRLMFGERLLRNSAIAAAVILVALAMKNSEIPLVKSAVSGLTNAVTAEINIDEQLGKLTFVRNILPESVAVFFGETTPAFVWPVAGGVTHAFSETEPYVVIETKQSTVRIPAEGQVTEVLREESGMWRVRIAHKSGWESEIQGLAGVAAAVGDTLKASSNIGILLSDNGMQVALALYKDGKAVNPVDYIPISKKTSE